MLDNFRNIDIHWKNAHDRIPNVRTASHDEKGRKLVVQVGDDEDTSGVDLILRAEDMQFKFNQFNNQGLYELYIPKDLPNKEVFLELTHDDFKITSEPFKIHSFKGVK